MTLEVAITALQWLVAVLGAPLLVGIVGKTKARLQGRRGAGVWQPYRNLRKLLVKEVVISGTTSWVFRLTPYVVINDAAVGAHGAGADHVGCIAVSRKHH